MADESNAQRHAESPSSQQEPHVTPAAAANAVVVFIAWLAVGFLAALVGTLVGLVLYLMYGLVGDERMWGGAVFAIGVFYALAGAACWSPVPAIASLIDRRIAFGMVLAGFLLGLVFFFVVWN